MVPGALGDLAIAVLQRNAAEFLNHAPGARAGVDPHHVHQMRVSTRRMRAALRLFADVLPSDAGSLNAELKWFAGQLGPVRDLDVQIHRVGASAETLGIAQVLGPYTDWLLDRHQRARHELSEAFESRRFGSLVQSLQRLDAWPLGDSPPVILEAPRRLRHAYTRVRKRAEAVGDRIPTAELHALRIRAKRLRYAAEFFQPSYGKSARRLAERVTVVQDLLGDLQDGVVSRHHVFEAIETDQRGWSAQTLLALGQLIQFEAEREKALRAALPVVYRDLQATWKALRHDEPKATS